MRKEQTLKDALSAFVELTREYINTDDGSEASHSLENQLLNHCLKCDELITTQYIFHRPPEGYTTEDICDTYLNTGLQEMLYCFKDSEGNTTSLVTPYQLISRKEAHELLGCDDYGLQNYELEMELDRYVGLGFIINEECRKESGRYYQL